MRAFLARLYLFSFFDSFLVIFPIYPVMFADAVLTPIEISVSLACWSATTFLVQVPAGVIADRRPRRYVLALAQLGRGAAFVVWLIWPYFWGFLAGLVLWGLKSAFNGAFEALLYDELKAVGRTTDYARVFGRTRAINAAANVAAALAAAVVIRWGYGAAIGASLVSVAIASTLAASLPAKAPTLNVRDRSYFVHLRQGLGYAASDPTVLSVIAFAALALTLGGALEEFWPIFGAKVGLSRPMIALFVAGQQTMEATGALLAYRMSALRRVWLYGLFAVAGLMLALAAMLYNAPAMALLALYSGVMRLVDVAYAARLQPAIPSENRATISSVRGFASQVGISSLYLLLGPLAQATSYQTAFLACGLVGAAIGVGYLATAVRASSPASRRT
jgi:MFS family permease